MIHSCPLLYCIHGVGLIDLQAILDRSVVHWFRFLSLTIFIVGLFEVEGAEVPQ